ncbi:SDR family oxidoreductase [Agrobacterium rhizogenes]|nr:SDR family oxidoreductase [Rhizobium rhizogenes]NTG56450.1 SDR family oxidoreductase [Rhizobium rhizogenes]NTH02135.1 SDR family oxidoreductase [Rhizobium rhizogenes]NTI57846.1 SDR family oxidoreductase [Rhizobium rhizogenes]
MNKEKWAVVTGIASGIGAATAEILREKGFRILGIDRAEVVVADCYLRADLSRADDIDALVANIDVPIKALCNVAGLPPTAGALATMKVNFFGLRDLTEKLVPKLVDEASIVNVASLAGMGWAQNLDRIRACLATSSLADAEGFVARHGITDENSYFFSKEVLIAWTLKSWSRWRERGIRMNTVSPGPVMTPIHKDFLATLGERAAKDAERVERPAFPQEIAPVIAFLCSNESRWIRATNIAADSGLFAAAQEEILSF